MTDDRAQRIRRRLTTVDGAALGTAQLCAVCAEVTAMSGAGIMLMDGDLPRGTVCTTNDVSAVIEELQYTLGEGPCVDAFQHRHPVVEPDLADPTTIRWPTFAPAAVRAGARAVFGFPLDLGGARLGALNLYRDRPGPLTADQHADAVVMAGIAARAVIDMQTGAPDGALGAELEVGSNFQFVVHQAAGMVAVQLGASVTEALVRLRAHAFAHGRLVAAVAGDVVARRLRFDNDGSAE